MKNGRPFIIDFEYAEPHECQRAGDIVEGVKAPDWSDFGCGEIYKFCYDNKVWRTGEHSSVLLWPVGAHGS